DGDAGTHLCLEAGSRGANFVRAGRDTGDTIIPAPIGFGLADLAGFQIAGGDLRVGDHGALLVLDRPQNGSAHGLSMKACRIDAQIARSNGKKQVRPRTRNVVDHGSLLRSAPKEARLLETKPTHLSTSALE